MGKDEDCWRRFGRFRTISGSRFHHPVILDMDPASLLMYGAQTRRPQLRMLRRHHLPDAQWLPRGTVCTSGTGRRQHFIHGTFPALGLELGVLVRASGLFWWTVARDQFHGRSGLGMAPSADWLHGQGSFWGAVNIGYA